MILTSVALAAPMPQVNTQSGTPIPGQLLPGAVVPTSSLSQTGDPSSQITPQSGQNPVTAVRNFLGD
ncbi:hypothetical protein HDV06_003600, partial [Boothiomyces sp. JEL0866]